MPPCQAPRSRGAFPKALATLIGLGGCLGAVAYAAAAREAGDTATERRPSSVQPPRPEIIQHPDRVATSTSARFSFTVGQRRLRFQCRLDRGRWRACRAPIVFVKLVAGAHVFSVRALDDRGRRSAKARFRWRLLEPKDFSIVPRLDGLSQLYPGAPPVALPVLIANPNPVPIFLTSLRATATADPRDCRSAENLVLTPSSVSDASPLRVPAGGSAGLPAPGASAPAIQLRDLPVNQDSCQAAQFPLAFSGKARG
jgi:hypothetical protein